MFDNYDALAGYKSVETAVDRSMKYSNTKGTSFSGEGDYLIIVAGSATASKIYSYAAYKAKLGYKPSIIHLTSGSSMAQIKATVQNAYTNWTLKPIYVLLVGDGDSTLSTATNSVLQVNWKRAADFGISYSYGIVRGYIPNDHYYSLVSGTDYYADVYVSRFNCKDTITLNTIMNKTIAYETNPPLSNPNWFTHCISLAGKESGRIFDTTAVQFWKNLKAYGWTHWDSLVETSSWTPSQAQVTDSMNDGSNVMLFRGHGAEGYDGDSDDGSGYAWFGGADKGYITMCTNEMIAAMNNPAGECGFNFSPTCLAGNFAYPSTVRDSSSMGDYWTQLNSKGGVGLFAATNVSMSFYNDSMALGISHAITGDVAKREFAKLCTYGKIYMEKFPTGSASTFQLEAYLMNPLGDPAVVMYTKAPKKLTASHESSVEARLDTITITITDGTKAAVSGATVCLYDTLETTPIQQIATTDAAGKAVFVATYTKTGTIFISASKQDYVPYMGTVSINAATAKNEISLTGSFGDKGVVLDWNVSGDADNILVYRKTDGSFKRIATLSSDAKSYTDKEYADGRNDYKVAGYRNGSEIFSSSVSVNSLSIKESLAVVQNGNGYSMEFISSRSGEASYDIIDRTGRIIEKSSFDCRTGRNSISLPYLSGGIYFVRVHSGQNVLTSRFASVR